MRARKAKYFLLILFGFFVATTTFYQTIVAKNNIDCK